MNCPKCGSVLHPSASFCPACGHSLIPAAGTTEARQLCPICGRPNPENEIFCVHCGAPLAASANLGRETGQLPEQTILKKRYLIMRKIAQGGMGAVYVASDLTLKDQVWAIKEISYAVLDELPPAEKENTRKNLQSSFQREFTILRQSHHPNLPIAQDYFEQHGRAYIVLEFIRGQTLENILKNLPPHGFLPEDVVLTWAVQLCYVLDYLHAQNPPIIYRDLKPSNVMEVDNIHTIKLIDFGIARFYKPSHHGDTLHFGTLGYLAPEIVDGEQASASTDIYALGSMLHQLLTNTDPSLSPFKFPPVTYYNPAVSERTCNAIQRALSLKAADRPRTAREFATLLTGSANPQPVSVIRSMSGFSPNPSPAGQPASGGLSLSSSTVTLEFNASSHKTLSIFTPPGLDITLTPPPPWLSINPLHWTGSGRNVDVTLQTTRARPPFTQGEAAPPAWFLNLPGWLKLWLSLHVRALGVFPVQHQAVIGLQSSSGQSQSFSVACTVPPPGWQITLGWMVTLILFGAELGLLLMPLLWLWLLLGF